MLLGKKKKIFQYLTDKQASQSLTSFDTLLSECIAGTLKEKLREMGWDKISIHIDWLSDYKCIGIQGKVNGYFLDVQIEPSCFSIAYDQDEPDDAVEFALEDASSFYSAVKDTVSEILKL